MKLIRTIAMYTGYSYHGAPIETSLVTLYCDEDMEPEHIEILKRQQEMRLRRRQTTECGASEPSA